MRRNSLQRRFDRLSPLQRKFAVAGGMLATTIVFGGVVYAVAGAFGSDWPAFGDACPIEIYEQVLGEHSVNTTVIERAWAYMPLVRKAAAAFGVDPGLLAGLVHTESNWNPSAGSSAGAVGLTQFIPSTARSIFQSLYDKGNWPFKPLSSSNDPQAEGYFAKHGYSQWIDRTDPRQALWLSAALLRSLLDKGNLEWALAAYNAGPGVANDPQSQWPAETKSYVPGVIKRRGWYQEIDAICNPSYA